MQKKMPSRILRDGLISSERVAKLPDDVFRFYLSLFCVVDDYGCAEWAPLVLRGKLWPYRETPFSTVEINQFLDTVTHGEKPLVIHYQCKDKEYIQIQNFGQRHQAAAAQFASAGHLPDRKPKATRRLATT